MRPLSNVVLETTLEALKQIARIAECNADVEFSWTEPGLECINALSSHLSNVAKQRRRRQVVLRRSSILSRAADTNPDFSPLEWWKLNEKDLSSLVNFLRHGFFTSAILCCCRKSFLNFEGFIWRKAGLSFTRLH